MPLMKPAVSVRNFTPSSIALGSLTSTFHGAAAASQMVHGHAAGVIVTAVGVFAPSRLPLSSTARLRMFTPPSVPGRQVKLQLSCPLARCHVVAPSTETSTALTTPPPASAAVPAIVTADSAAMLAPVDGLVIVETGADTSVLSVAGNIPGCIDPGWVPMSASRLIVACCMATSGVALPESADVSWCVSSPHAHC